MQVLSYPHPMLRHVAFKVEQIHPAMKSHAEQMLELMYQHKGCGLAATQVGLNYAMVVINPRGKRDTNGHHEIVAINPRILRTLGQVKDEEGCLSLPDCHVNVVRAKWIKLTYTTLDGGTAIGECEGKLARIWQHEMDHLNGRLIIDHVRSTSPASRRLKVQLNRLVEEWRERSNLFPVL